MSDETAIVLPSQFNLAENDANELKQGLTPILMDRNQMMQMYESIIKLDIDNPQTAKMARELRLSLVKNRTNGIDKWHKTTKEFHLRAGQFIDAIKKREVEINRRMEETLQEIEDYQEKKREQEIQELFEARAAMLEPYKEFAPVLNYGTMKQEEFDKVLLSAKTTFEVKEKERREIAEKIATLEQRKAQLEPYKDTALAKSVTDEQLMHYQDESFAAFLENVIHESVIEKKEKERRTEVMSYKDYFKEANEFDYQLGRLDDQSYYAIIDKLRARKAEKELELERLRLENERLRKEQEEKDREAKRRQAEAEAARREAEAKLLEEQRKREKEEQDKRDAIRKREEEKDRLRKAPIKEGLEMWVGTFKLPMYPAADNETSIEIAQKFESFKRWSNELIEKTYGSKF